MHENCLPPAHANSEKELSRKVDKPEVSGKVDKPAVSGKVDYGLMKDYWLRYSFVKGLEKKKNSQSTTSSQESIHHASHEDTGVNVWESRDKSGAHPSAELAPPVQSVGDQVVQGSVVAGEVGAPLDALGVVAGPSSGSRDAPAGKLESTPPSNPGDNLYHSGDVLVDLDEEAPLPLLNSNQLWSSLVVVLLVMLLPLLEASFQLFPGMDQELWEVLQPPIKSTLQRNNIAAIPPPPEDFYFWDYTFEQVQPFQQCDAGEDGYCYISPDGKVFFCLAHL